QPGVREALPGVGVVAALRRVVDAGAQAGLQQPGGLDQARAGLVLWFVDKVLCKSVTAPARPPGTPRGIDRQRSRRIRSLEQPMRRHQLPETASVCRTSAR